MNIGMAEITSVGILLTSAVTLYKIVFGQGKARAREENYTREIDSLKKQDKDFTEDIKILKDDVTSIRINQEKTHGEIKQSIANLEINILKEFRKQNGH